VQRWCGGSAEVVKRWCRGGAEVQSQVIKERCIGAHIEVEVLVLVRCEMMRFNRGDCAGCSCRASCAKVLRFTRDDGAEHVQGISVVQRCRGAALSLLILMLHAPHHAPHMLHIALLLHIMLCMLQNIHSSSCTSCSCPSTHKVLLMHMHGFSPCPSYTSCLMHLIILILTLLMEWAQG
jgi:hypothetical protein